MSGFKPPKRRRDVNPGVKPSADPDTKRLKALAKPDIEPEANVLKSSRASPPPKDDFDIDAADDAREYKYAQELELKREKVRTENKERKVRGEKPLKMPSKSKRDGASSRQRQASHSSDEDYSSADLFQPLATRELRYEGQILLPFNPLEELATLAPGVEPDEIALKQRALEQRGVSPRKVRLNGSAPRALGNGLLTWAKSDPLPSARAEAGAKEEDIKPFLSNSELDVPDDVSPDVKPNVPFSVDSKPSFGALQAAMTSSANEVDGVEDEEEQEDYSEEVVVAPWGSNRPVLSTNGPATDNEESEEEIYSEDEVEEAYSDDERASCEDRCWPYLSAAMPVASITISQSHPSTGSSQAQSRSLVPVGSKVLAVKERPTFPFTDEQRKIGPYAIDQEDPTMAIPAPINRFLRNYQREGVDFLYSKYKQGYGGVLGDDMGLGKTVQLSAIMRKTGTSADKGRRKSLIRGDNVESIPAKRWPTALIVCPTSLVDNWSRELDTVRRIHAAADLQWGFFEYKVLRSSLDKGDIETLRLGYLDILLTSNEMCIRQADDLKTAPISVVIVDEAHRMKKLNGRLALAVKRLRANACFALTGTLIQNRMEEMWSILDFVHRGWAGTFKEWRAYAAKPVTQGHRRDGTLLEVCMAIKRVGELKNKVLPHFYLRRDKGLIAHELPRKLDKVVLCPLAKHQEGVYKRVVESEDMAFILKAKDFCSCGSDKTRITCCYTENSQGDDYRTAILKMFHALGRCANHLALLYTSSNDPPKVQQIAKRIFEFCVGLPYDPNVHNKIEAALDSDNCGKWTLLSKLLKDWRSRSEEKNKILVFSNSVRLLKMIYDFINTSPSLSGFGCNLFTGEVDKDERMSVVDRFQDPNGDLSIMLVSTMAGGVGLNLTAANKVVIFDPNWNPANDLQAMDRAFRIGQTRPVDVYRLIGQGTVEELMYERQIYKQQRSRQMNQGTFERRTHAGYEGATDMRNQGELFGVHNLFRYWPGGYVTDNLNRIREDEDQFRQDMIEAEYEDETDDEDGVAAARRERDKRRAAAAAEHDETSLLCEITSDGSAPADHDEDILSKLGISSMEHDKAFRDSPEERELYEKGLEILKRQPHLATMLANDVARLPAEIRPQRKARKSEESKELKREQVDEPWKNRFAAGRIRNRGKLLVDSDDE
ncbi:hypothetical protein CspHIS471_0206780 [Cutaneotrichosporon sp. HIS471]|nr:hypothetical protein CspHIS471_0206780 [Cutaneotrichosporon sp. HIS471]